MADFISLHMGEPPVIGDWLCVVKTEAKGFELIVRLAPVSPPCSLGIEMDRNEVIKQARWLAAALGIRTIYTVGYLH